MKNRLISLLLILSTSIMLIGCGNEAMPDVENYTEHKGEAVTIRYALWGSEARREYTVESVKKFEEMHPGIKVEIEFDSYDDYKDNLDRMMADGLEADVMQLDYYWLDSFFEEDAFANLFDYTKFLDLSGFTDKELKLGEADGFLYAIPVSIGTAANIYNKTIMDAYGVKVNDTFSSLRIAAQTLAPYDIYVLGIDKQQLSVLFTIYYEERFKKPLFTEEGKFNANRYELIDMLGLYKTLVQEKVFCPIDLFTEDYVKDGKVAGVIGWSDSIASIEKLMTDGGYEPILGDFIVYDVFSKPVYYNKPSMMLAVSNNSQNKEASAVFLDYLLNDVTNAILQGTEKGVPVSNVAEMTLMEAGLLDNDEYLDEIMMGYKDKNMMIKPRQLEDKSNVSAFLSYFENYRRGIINMNIAIDGILGIKW